MANTINPQGAMKPLSMLVSGVALDAQVQVDLTNTDGTTFNADYIEVISANMNTGANQVIFAVAVSAAGYTSNDVSSAVGGTSGLGGWLGTHAIPVQISIPGININRITITNYNENSNASTYLINYGIKFLEHSMKNRQTDTIGN